MDLRIIAKNEKIAYKRFKEKNRNVLREARAIPENYE